ncbi:MAG: hypothetical protein ABW061_16045, partial [Polyangiaceae bacterium]
LSGTGLSCLVPGLVYSFVEQVREVPWLGVHYYDPAPTPFGEVAYLVLGAALLITFVRVVRDMRRQLPRARLSAWVLGVITVGSINDMLATSNVYFGPNLLGLALVLTLGLLGFSTSIPWMSSYAT